MRENGCSPPYSRHSRDSQLQFFLLMFASDWVYGLHGRGFPMPREAFSRALYQFIGFWKIIVISVNLVPWLALVLMT